MATTSQIHHAIAAVIALDPGIASTLAFPDRTIGRIPCAVVYPGRTVVQKTDGGPEFNIGVCQVHVLCELLPSKADGIAKAADLKDRLRDLFRSHVLAVPGNTCSIFVISADVAMARYQDKSYAAVILEVKFVDELTVTYQAGVPLVS